MFCVGSRVRQTPEEGRLSYRPKRYEYNNKDEDDRQKTLNDKKSSFFVFERILSQPKDIITFVEI